jgi:hypothetical protein
MIKLVALERAKNWLRIIHDADDQRLEMAILAASQAVLDYLGIDADEFLDSDGQQQLDSDGSPEGVDEVYQVATAMLVGKLVDGQDEKALPRGGLPQDVQMLLYIRKRQLGIA